MVHKINTASLVFLKYPRLRGLLSASIVKPRQGNLIVSPMDKSLERDHIFVYRLTSILHHKAQKTEVYFAVPNGGCVTLHDLPYGPYKLRKMI